MIREAVSNEAKCAACKHDADGVKKASMVAMYTRYKTSLAEFDEVDSISLFDLVKFGDCRTLLVDCRMATEQAVSMIPGSIPQSEFDRLLLELPQAP